MRETLGCISRIRSILGSLYYLLIPTVWRKENLSQSPVIGAAFPTVKLFKVLKHNINLLLPSYGSDKLAQDCWTLTAIPGRSQIYTVQSWFQAPGQYKLLETIFIGTDTMSMTLNESGSLHPGFFGGHWLLVM